MYRLMFKLATVPALFIAFAGMSVAVQAQDPPLPTEDLPLAKDLGVTRGQTVTPAYEGWYEKPDGTVAAVFGYFNRNTEQTLEIPVGENNRVDGGPDHGQPTVFHPGRHWGVFTVTLPDADESVTWHLESNGRRYSIPANLSSDYMVDAIAGDANGNLPPEIRFDEEGPVGSGPAGVRKGPVQANVGSPITLQVLARDDGTGAFAGEEAGTQPLELAWMKQQGPGDVTFSNAEQQVPVSGGEASTRATFNEPGEYLVRVRVNDASGRVGGGHAQCCWTNGFIEVNVRDSS